MELIDWLFSRRIHFAYDWIIVGAATRMKLYFNASTLAAPYKVQLEMVAHFNCFISSQLAFANGTNVLFLLVMRLFLNIETIKMYVAIY